MSLVQTARKALPRALYPSSLLRRLVQHHTGFQVVGGPFKGMRYIDRSVWGAYIPKLLGTYELELHQSLERAIADGHQHMVDVGGAEGYYAVGLLFRMPTSGLTVFEQLADARSAIRELADRNAVASRLDIQGSCSPEALQRSMSKTGATLVLCDVEGYEQELLDPTKVPALLGADLLVEVHDAQVRGVSDQLLERFGSTHECLRITQSSRSLANYPYRDVATRVWPAAVLKYGLNEFRSPENGWLWLRSKQRAARAAH